MTVSTFNDLEALRIAVQIEKRGERFYKLAQGIVADPEARNVLAHLEEQERDHAHTFQTLYNQAFEKKEDFDDTYLFDPDSAAYLQAMVESTVFPSQEKEEESLKNVRTMEDVLTLGIRAEKDSILFYAEMVNHSKLEEAKQAFQRLLQEERKHVTELQEMKNKGLR